MIARNLSTINTSHISKKIKYNNIILNIKFSKLFINKTPNFYI